LHAPQLGAEENRALYGKCNNPFGHGHNYELEVSATGPVDDRSGQVLDPRALDALVRSRVLEVFAHRNLNEECEAFRAVVPTSENLGREIMRRLKAGWGEAFPAGGPRLERIVIAETARNIFEVEADEIE
jgi:6-pyruvoyltetrahydropterin/6-carboxytetrahydropterin synthase